MLVRTTATLFLLPALLFGPGLLFRGLDETRGDGAISQEKTRRPEAQPSPTPPREEVPQESDEVVRVETNLTNIFFTAADKSKRFVNTVKREDIRILEDGQPQEIFTFQQNIDLPLSVAVLIDTSGSEERTLPDEKAAARSFIEEVIRPNRDEAAVVSF